MEKNKFIRRNGPGRVVLDQMAFPKPGQGEVLLKVVASGVCGSDIARYKGVDALEKPGYDEIPFGHEFSGRIVEVGDGVEMDLSRLYVIAPLIPCHKCLHCEAGNFTQCGTYSFIGTRQNGSLAEYVIAPVKNLIPLPEGMDAATGAMLEPLAVVLQPLMFGGLFSDKGDLSHIDTVLVTGMGLIGLIAVRVFSHFGVKNIVASHNGKQRLELAGALGATHGVNVQGENVDNLVRDLGGAQVVFEAAGSPGSILSAYGSVAANGNILWVGKQATDFTLPKWVGEAMMRKQIRGHGTFMSHRSSTGLQGWPGDSWQLGLKLLTDGIVPVEDLIDGPCATLEQAAVAIQSNVTGECKFTKIMYLPA